MKSKFTWIFTLLLAFFIQFSFAQEKTITGIVTDAAGMPIPGVTVMVNGVKPGVQTDFDGRYSISASVGQKLTFQFIGMSNQSATVGTSNTISVTMQENVQELEGVVVQAYRTTTRARSNVASTTVTSKTIEGRPNASFIQTLQGQVPGLNISTGSGQPGSNNTTVILRGIGSINGNTEPLYVIDGIPLNSDNFRSINPNDIESISVLKDAGATSIYGNRGANGVIVVKTKRASYDSALSFKYTSTTGFTSLQNNKYDIASAKDQLKLEQIVGRGMGATLSDEDIANFSINTDWTDYFFRTGITQNHVLNMQSGSKNLSSFSSLAYFDQEGILPGTDLKRFNFRNNLTGKSDDNKFNYSTNISLNYSQRNQSLAETNGGASLGNVYQNPLQGALSSLQYYDPNGYVNGQQLYDDYNVATGENAPVPYVLLDYLKTHSYEVDEIKLVGSGQASYKITEALTAGASIGLDFNDNRTVFSRGPESYVAIATRNSNEGQEFEGSTQEALSRDFSANVNARLSYNKVFAEKHTLEVSLFTEYFKAHFKSFGFTQNGLNPKTYAPGAGTGYIPYDPDNNFYVPSVRASKLTAGLFSYFGSADYDYDSKYGLGVTVRRDASYRFSETNRWGTFYSVSARWNINNEDFMKDTGFDMLKLRGSYGTAGNQNILGGSIYSGATLSRNLYTSSTGYANLPSFVVSQLGNNTLKWETITQANVGLDFGVFKNRLRGTFDVYQKTTDDLFQNTPISAINATTAINANYGSLRNRGIEALLAYDIFSTEDFVFTLNFNGSYNKNIVRDLPGSDLDIGNDQVNVIGRSLFEFNLVEYVGVNTANGNLLFRDSSGGVTENPSNDDRRLTGKQPFPTYQGGFGFDTSYKGFFLTTQFNFVQDIYRFDTDLQFLQDPSGIGQYPSSTDLTVAWTPENSNSDIPRLDASNLAIGNTISDRYLRDASYVRLRYVSLGYNFPKTMLEQTLFTGVRIYGQAENLVTWSKWRGWDPESNAGSTFGGYPTPKIISVGLELEF